MPNGSMDDGLKTIYFKKAMGGGCLAATRQCIIIGVFDEAKDQSATHCVGLSFCSIIQLISPHTQNLTIENLARYLFENNF